MATSFRFLQDHLFTPL
jgi:hypothetical protein